MQKKTYRTPLGAKRAANKAYSPVIAKLPDGSYDWFPPGYPLLQGSVKVSQWVINQWRNF